MSVYKSRDEAVVPALEPTNWNPLIGVGVVFAVLVLTVLLYFLAAGIRTSSALGLG